MSGRATAHFLQSVAASASTFTLALGDPPRPLARAARLAGDSASRRQGLLGRAALDEDEALVIAPTQGIHTFGMRFALDVVFVDRTGTVLAVSSGVRPNRVRLCWRAFAAIELGPGRTETADVKPGARIVALSTREVFLP